MSSSNLAAFLRQVPCKSFNANASELFPLLVKPRTDSDELCLAVAKPPSAVAFFSEASVTISCEAAMSRCRYFNFASKDLRRVKHRPQDRRLLQELKALQLLLLLRTELLQPGQLHRCTT